MCTLSFHVLYRQFMDYFTIEPASGRNSDPSRLELTYDLEWLAVLRRTHSLTQVTRQTVAVPTVVEPITPEVSG